MGALITRSLRKNQANPFAGMISRGADGNTSLDLSRASGIAGADSALWRGEIQAMRQALGDNPSVDALRSYSRDTAVTGPGDAGESLINTFSPFSSTESLGRQALDSATEQFEIVERGQADAARIAQQGREKAAIANMGSGIASAQRRALGAAEQNAYDQSGGSEGGVADIIEGSNVEEAGGEEGGNDTTRRKRQSYGGAGLAMRI